MRTAGIYSLIPHSYSQIIIVTLRKSNSYLPLDNARATRILAPGLYCCMSALSRLLRLRSLALH